MTLQQQTERLFIGCMSCVSNIRTYHCFTVLFCNAPLHFTHFIHSFIRCGRGRFNLISFYRVLCYLRLSCAIISLLCSLSFLYALYSSSPSIIHGASLCFRSSIVL